jgi:alkyl sulfatase BDS1-like metallo-beta-lactamase superfamily hydrolase
VQELPTPDTASADMVKAQSLDMFFDYAGVRLNGERAGDAHIAINFDFGDPEGTYMVELVNGVLNHTAGAQADDADAKLTLSRDTLNSIMLHQTTLDDAVSAGDVTVEGDQAKLTELVSYLDTFEFWFNIVTP